MERLPEGVTIEFFNFLASEVDALVVKPDAVSYTHLTLPTIYSV